MQITFIYSSFIAHNNLLMFLFLYEYTLSSSSENIRHILENIIVDSPRSRFTLDVAWILLSCAGCLCFVIMYIVVSMSVIFRMIFVIKLIKKIIILIHNISNDVILSFLSFLMYTHVFEKKKFVCFCLFLNAQIDKNMFGAVFLFIVNFVPIYVFHSISLYISLKFISAKKNIKL